MHNFDEMIDRHHTYSTQWDYCIDRFGESDILPFSISDTDFTSPQKVIDTLVTSMQKGIYGYTRWNHDDYKQSIIRYFQTRHNYTPNPNHIVYSPSVLYSIAKLIELLTKPNDQILTFNPMYDAFFHVIKDNDRILLPANLMNQNNAYFIDYDDFQSKASKAKLILLCSPHNPTGKVFSKEELTFIIHTASKYNIPIISDEIHADIVRDATHTPILSLSSQNIYLVTSASKTFNLPALGGSYAILPNDQIRESFQHQTRYKDFVNSASLPSILATMTAYNDCLDYIDELNKYINHNFEILQDFCNKHPKLQLTKSNATYLAWINVEKLNVNDQQLQDLLVHQAKVGFMNGRVYGDPNFIRINIGCPSSKLIEGLNRLDSIYSQL